MIQNFYTAGHRIERFTLTEDSFGSPVKNWAVLATVSGKLWQTTGTEMTDGEKDTTTKAYKFATALIAITELDRYIDPDGNYYNILAVARRTRPDGTGHMELTLEKVT